MRLRTKVLPPAVALVTLLAVGAVTRGGSNHLPAPLSVISSGGGSASSPTTIAPTSLTAGKPLALGGCAVSVGNPAPAQSQTGETATVLTTAGAHVRLEADYSKTRSIHGGSADGRGTIAFALPINHAQPGVTVRVSATASLLGVQRTCQTAFTPVAVVTVPTVRAPHITVPHVPKPTIKKVHVPRTPPSTKPPVTTPTTKPPVTTPTTKPPVTTPTTKPPVTTTLPPVTTTLPPVTTTVSVPFVTIPTTVPPTTPPSTTAPPTTTPITLPATTTTVPTTTVPVTTTLPPLAVTLNNFSPFGFLA